MECRHDEHRHIAHQIEETSVEGSVCINSIKARNDECKASRENDIINTLPAHPDDLARNNGFWLWSPTRLLIRDKFVS